MPLTNDTTDAINLYLTGELTRYINKSKAAGDVVDLMPFHARLLPLLFKVRLNERSFSTRSGGWFQQIAKLVAEQFHPVVHQQYDIPGRIQPEASSHIETILGQMDKGLPKRKPSRQSDMDRVRSMQSPGGADLSVRADLFVQTASEEEWYFEMKTPQPNKGQCKEMKRFILQVAALRYETRGQAFASTAYNPRGDGMPISDGRIKQFLEPGKDILVGREFWEKIGDASTYDELLAISESVGETITKLLESEQIL